MQTMNRDVISASARVILAAVLLVMPTVHADGAAASSTGIEQGIELFDEGRYVEARELFESLVQGSRPDPQARYWLGRSWFALEQFERAADQFQKLVAEHKDVADYHFWLARARGEQAAHSGWFAQLALAPKVRDSLERAVELDPAHADARLALANYYLRIPSALGGSMDRADVQARALMELDDVKGSTLHAYILEKTDRRDQAGEVYAGLVERHGSDIAYPEFHKRYGNYLLGEGRVQQALAEFERYAELDPDSADAQYRLGNAYGALGDTDRAAGHYRSALVLDPSFERAQRKLDHMQR